MAEKKIQLQSADGLDNLFPITMGNDHLVWENSAPKTAITTANFTLGLTRKPAYLVIQCLQYNSSASQDYMATAILIPDTWATITSIRFDGSTNVACERSFRYNSTTDNFAIQTAYYGSAWNSLGNSSGAYLIPQKIWAVY